MRSPILRLSLALVLMLSAFSCKKPDQTTSEQENQPTTSNTPATTEPGRNAENAQRKESGKMREAQKPEAPKPIVVPAGTTLSVRLGEALSSKTSQSGQSFSGTLAQPVVVGGETVIPSGAAVSGTVVDAKSAGRFKGASNLSIKLTSVEVAGTPRQVETAALSSGQAGKGKRTAGMVGGGAGLGALVGGLAGGGKGAAIGALAGAGAGTAGAGLTGNRDVTLPAESVVSFQLQSPLEIRR
ncbi:MAG TPA: hypothetical protein VFA89_10100 [Terriglobales bacterium]|nr:hypothetical protein [Terriglobales bacterium]